MEEYQRATSDIISNVNKLENILRESESVDAGNEKILNDLFNLRAKISEFSESKNELSGRTKALKEKIHSVDEKIKKESDEVKNRIRKYFKTLGIRVDQETMKDVENHIEITITFKEDSSASLSLAYDTLSEDFHCKWNIILIISNKYLTISLLCSTSSTINST